MRHNSAFTVAFPSVPAGGLLFNSTTMEDRRRSDGHERPVGLLIFPGVFKLTAGVRTCMVKSKVVCIDEMTQYFERSTIV
jgi:hypothetical protein